MRPKSEQNLVAPAEVSKAAPEGTEEPLGPPTRTAPGFVDPGLASTQRMTAVWGG